MGRPPKPIDEAMVLRLARIHCTTEEIASIVGVSKDTLERRCMPILEEGRSMGRASLRRLQWKTARGGNATMQIWLGKQLLKQTDKVEQVNAASALTVNISGVDRPHDARADAAVGEGDGDGPPAP
jgi:hypothetical protein